MSENLEIAASLRALAFKLENPSAFSAACHKEVVAVALAFTPFNLSDDQIVGIIMKALGGKANPQTLCEEIRRQRKV